MECTFVLIDEHGQMILWGSFEEMVEYRNAIPESASVRIEWSSHQFIAE